MPPQEVTKWFQSRGELVRAYAKIVGSIPSQGTYKNQAMNA